MGVLRWSWGRRRWRLWTVLLRGVRGTASERRDAVGASPVRRLVRAYVGTDAGDAAATTPAAAGTATPAATGSRARRTLAAVQARTHLTADRRRTPRRRHVNAAC